jgi:hypothetical protein
MARDIPGEIPKQHDVGSESALSQLRGDAYAVSAGDSGAGKGSEVFQAREAVAASEKAVHDQVAKIEELSKRMGALPVPERDFLGEWHGYYTALSPNDKANQMTAAALEKVLKQASA